MPLSRRTFDEGKRYQTVVFQENTHPGDFEWVELQDIQNAERRGALNALVTTGAVGDGFKVVGNGSSNAVLVTVGAMLRSGDRLILPDGQHPLVAGQFVFNMPISTPVTDRTDLVYLDVFTETVGPSQDPDIEDVLLGPTALRERTVYQFAVAQGQTTLPALSSGHTGVALATVARRGGDPAVNAADVTDVRPIAGLQPQFRPKNLIVVSPAGGQFTDLQTALNSIVGSSQSNPFTVLVEPGTYTSTVPITLNNPYVQVIGRDREATTVKVSPATGVLQGFVVNAANVYLVNLGLDFAPTATGNLTLLTMGSGSSARVENCLLGEQYFGANATNTMKGAEVAATATLGLHGSKLYAQIFGMGVNNAGTFLAKRSTISCHRVDALVNNGLMDLEDCAVVTNERTINSLNTFTARRTSFTTQTTKSVAGSGSNCVSLGGAVACTLSHCSVVSNINRIDVTDTSLPWDSVSVGALIFLSGTGTSVLEHCALAGLSDTGSKLDVRDCALEAGSFTSGPLAGQSVGVYAASSADVRIVGCVNTNGNAVYASGANPIVEGCTFRSDLSSFAMRFGGGTKAVVSNCTLHMLDTGSAANIEDTASQPTFAHCHFQEPFSGPAPTNAVSGVSGSKVFKGQNTKSAGITNLFAAAITTQTSIEA